ncbi:MAG: exo-alpha-sialidase [Actinobacteria bacterium]|nr:exo-alpha-sialidase [Actinomycetota bacterium]
MTFRSAEGLSSRTRNPTGGDAMPKTLLLIGTRKGLFLIEGEDRRDWTVRGPFCEGWPIYHAIHDPESGTIYAAAASEWHGAGVWRSGDLGESWELSSEGLSYEDDGGLKLSKVSGLTAAHGRLLAGAESVGIFESRDGGGAWSLLSTLEGQPGSESWNDPGSQPPGHLGVPAILPDAGDPKHLWAIVQGYGIFETTDDGETWTPRNKGLRADWPLENPEVGYCVHKLVRSPVDPERFYQQNHVGMHRSDDGGHSWTEITEGLPTEFGFAAAAHPHDRDTFYVIPLDPGHGRCMPEGQAAVWRTRDAGSKWERLDRGLPERDAHLGVLREGMAIDAHDSPGLYFGTSTGQVFASTDEGVSWDEIASYLPGISSVEVATVA